MACDNVTLLTSARVTRLETDPSGRSVRRVVVMRDGAREEYSADLVVLAAGAIVGRPIRQGAAWRSTPASAYRTIRWSGVALTTADSTTERSKVANRPPLRTARASR